MKLKKYIPFMLIILLAIASAAILWLTVFSRLGTDARQFYPPFWSYGEIIQGSRTVLFQNIENIVLFVPIGVIAALFLQVEVKKGLLVGLLLSLVIECSQWLLWLGAFEFDDLLHNAVGAAIGTFLVKRTVTGKWLRQQLGEKKKSLRILLCLIILFIALPLGCQGIKNLEMKRLAAQNDKENSKNLLVLSADPRYIGQTAVSVVYNSDGSILIEGKSDNRAWIQISKLTLAPGLYYMEGLSGLRKSTIGLELAAFDYEQDKYVMVGHEVGATERLYFELQETSKMEVLISLYPGWEGGVTARPAIFRED